MKSFPISINNKIIMSEDILNFLRHGEKSKAIQYITLESNCTENEAEEIISDLKHMIALKDMPKETKMVSKQVYIDCTDRKIGCNSNIPKCPTCGSTNIRTIGELERGVSVLSAGLFSKKINKSFKCNNCGYTW